MTKTWADVHCFFRGLTAKLEDDCRDKWLIRQFTQYLEWQGMSDFTGFSEETFSLFVEQKKRPEQETIGSGANGGAWREGLEWFGFH